MDTDKKNSARRRARAAGQAWRQAAFTMAWRGLRIQGWQRSVEEGSGLCLYRCDGARRCCAVGWLIPDANIVGLLRDASPKASHPEVMRALADHLKPTPKGAAAFLLRLQRVHDDALDNDLSLENRMRHFANIYGLDIPPPARWEE